MLKIIKPTFLVNERVARKNIQTMAQKATQSGVRFRPHFKTHFSATIGQWFKDEGVQCITVSSIDMAKYFASNGWNDITIAFPANICQIEDLNTLAREVSLNLVIESQQTLEYLMTHMESPVHIFVKIDTGYGRTGIPAEHLQTIKSLIEATDAPLQFRGLLAHFGHSYKERDKSKIQDIHRREVQKLVELKNQLEWSEMEISIGDTPSCSLVDSFDFVNEVRPGNFVFYDMMQVQIGSCSPDQISVCMACPIVAIHPERQEVIIHGGAVHFSKDFIVDEKGRTSYGHVAVMGEDGWGIPEPEVYLRSLSQEHGIVSAPIGYIEQLNVGDILYILPIHSCLTANLMKDYYTLEGKKILTMNSI